MKASKTRDINSKKSESSFFNVKANRPFFTPQKQKPEKGLEAEANFVAQNATSHGASQFEDKEEALEVLGRKMGADFSDVNLHTGAEAEKKASAQNAKAYAQGSNIYFNKNQLNISSGEGAKLLAHELAHTIQQGAVPTTSAKVTRQNAASGSVQRQEFEDHEVAGNANSYHMQAVNGLRLAQNRASIHLNSYGLEVRNAISQFQRYAHERINEIGEEIPGAGFINSAISIALSAVPIPGAGALLRVVGKALRDAIVSEIRSKLTSAAQQVTASRDTNDLETAVHRIGSETTDIATSVRDRAMTEINQVLDEIIVKLNNNDELTSQESEIVGMFYDAPSENADYYLSEYFGIPNSSERLREVQLGIYGNLVRAFEQETFQVTRTTRQSIYWTTMATGRDSGTQAYARHMARGAVEARRNEMANE